MLKSVSPRLAPRGAGEPRIIRLTTDQEAVLQEQFNRCPRAPHTADIVLLAAETGLSEADVQVCNHRVLRHLFLILLAVLSVKKLGKFDQRYKVYSFTIFINLFFLIP